MFKRRLGIGNTLCAAVIALSSCGLPATQTVVDIKPVPQESKGIDGPSCSSLKLEGIPKKGSLQEKIYTVANLVYKHGVPASLVGGDAYVLRDPKFRYSFESIDGKEITISHQNVLGLYLFMKKNCSPRQLSVSLGDGPYETLFEDNNLDGINNLQGDEMRADQMECTVYKGEKSFCSDPLDKVNEEYGWVLEQVTRFYSVIKGKLTKRK